MTPADKIAALRSLVEGAPDVFAIFSTGSHEERDSWRPVYTPLSDRVILHHLQGHLELGTYPMQPVDSGHSTCTWILADFDGKHGDRNWQADVQRTVAFLHRLFDGCPVFVNLSRSGQGAHVRMLFRKPVPAWLARRWLTSWLEEAGIIDEDREIPSSFDRLIPPQDMIDGTVGAHRAPGNLAGCPMNGRRARDGGATLALDPRKVARGDFTPDGEHWRHTMEALEMRGWGEPELRAAAADCPSEVSTRAPRSRKRTLPVVAGDDSYLDFTVTFCEFFRAMQEGHLNYHLWVALASQLHHFGDSALELWHAISATDPRYKPSNAEKKWRQTSTLAPVTCRTIASIGWRCPHLDSKRCGGAQAPAYFAEHARVEVL